jgi:hypothetical protein
VLTHFTAKHHGRRSYSVKQKVAARRSGEKSTDGGTEGDLP